MLLWLLNEIYVRLYNIDSRLISDRRLWQTSFLANVIHLSTIGIPCFVGVFHKNETLETEILFFKQLIIVILANVIHLSKMGTVYHALLEWFIKSKTFDTDIIFFKQLISVILAIVFHRPPKGIQEILRILH